MTEKITRDMIASGYKQDVIRLTTGKEFSDYYGFLDDKDIGVLCVIGDYWFYFGGEEADLLSVAEYKKNFSEDTIIDQIHSTLEAFAEDEELNGDEYRYYYYYLKECLEETNAI